MDHSTRSQLLEGMVIPACPLALTSERKIDVQRQRALIRYYADAGVGGVAVGVHTTQFAIRDPKHSLFQPVLEIAAEELRNQEQRLGRPLQRIGGIVGNTKQAVAEATLLRDLGFQAGLLSLAGHSANSVDDLINHCKEVAAVIPVIGFYLQPAVGGTLLPYEFWRRFAEIENVVAIKMAPFNRYQTLDVVRAVADSGREDIAMYTGNDDNIVIDLLTEYRFPTEEGTKRISIVGGLLGHWACWTKKAVELFDRCKTMRKEAMIPREMLSLANEVTDCNAALFDSANAFQGCIPGIHEVLRRQGLLAGTWCLDPNESMGPGQADELTRIQEYYPHLTDDEFVKENLDRWMS